MGGNLPASELADVAGRAADVGQLLRAIAADRAPHRRVAGQERGGEEERRPTSQGRYSLVGFCSFRYSGESFVKVTPLACRMPSTDSQSLA